MNSPARSTFVHALHTRQPRCQSCPQATIFSAAYTDLEQPGHLLAADTVNEGGASAADPGVGVVPKDPRRAGAPEATRAGEGAAAASGTEVGAAAAEDTRLSERRHATILAGSLFSNKTDVGTMSLSGTPSSRQARINAEMFSI